MLLIYPELERANEAVNRITKGRPTLSVLFPWTSSLPATSLQHAKVAREPPSAPSDRIGSLNFKISNRVNADIRDGELLLSKRASAFYRDFRKTKGGEVRRLGPPVASSGELFANRYEGSRVDVSSRWGIRVRRRCTTARRDQEEEKAKRQEEDEGARKRKGGRGAGPRSTLTCRRRGRRRRRVGGETELGPREVTGQGAREERRSLPWEGRKAAKERARGGEKEPREDKSESESRARVRLACRVSRTG
uniref:Uncharacterized protein n=1 Tax=Vespula pensylvanica TaxID=30213 RepID=A0A834JTK4_VESPE|nr:hypothetical protein H0235_016771 [Vespula pensylvanica]